MSDDTTQQKKPTLLKVLIPVFGIILVVFGGLSLVKKATPPAQQRGAEMTQAGAAIPDFELQEFPGGKTLKFSELKGKVFLVNFWATWCEACMVEMPSIVQLQKSYKDKGLQVVAINVDEKPDAVLPATLKKLGIDFPVYMDPETKAGDVFDVHAIPLTVILDANRKVLLTHNGERDWNGTDIRAQMDQWLAGR